LLPKIPLLKSWFYLTTGNLDKSIENLDKSANFFIEKNQTFYPEVIFDSDVSSGLAGVNDTMKSEVANLLKGFLPQAILVSYSSIVSNIYYMMGMIAYENGSNDYAKDFFQTAVYLNPTLSLLHVELANLYLNQGLVDKADEVINYCMRFQSPSQHCREFREANFYPPFLHKPGFLKDDVRNNLFY